MQERNNIIDQILDEHKAHLGKHFEHYRNHVYRVFILCQNLDDNPENTEKYAIAAVFHDLGIWTDKTFDYLEPSIAQANIYLVKNNKEHWLDEVSMMIDMHHKRSRYLGPFQETVENFRRADWIDVTKGRMSFKVGKETFEKIVAEYPRLGFHKFLFIQTLKNFIKSPLNPLPMFKK